MAKHRTDARQDAYRARGQQILGLGFADHRKPARLVQLGRDLGQKPVGGQTDRNRQADLFLDPFLQPCQLKRRRAAVQALGPRQVYPGLVQRQGLHQWRQLMDRAENAGALVLVLGKVGLYDHRLGAGFQRLEHGHGAADAIKARHIAGGRNYAALSAPYDHRLVAQLWPVALFNRGIEGVAVHVRHGQLGQFRMVHHTPRATGRTLALWFGPHGQTVPAKRLGAQNLSPGSTNFTRA